MLGVGAAFGLTADFCNAKRAHHVRVSLASFRHAADEILTKFYRDKSNGENPMQKFLIVRDN